MLSVPKAKVVRGYSFYGFSFVYVIFQDGTDPYWARSRVLEYLSQISGQLPRGVKPTLGPDATGVGWAFMYSINSTKRDLQELRSYQDWYLKYQLSAVPGRLRSRVGRRVREAIPGDGGSGKTARLQPAVVHESRRPSNAATAKSAGARSKWPKREFILRVKGYIQNLDELRKVAVGVGRQWRADSAARRGHRAIRAGHAPRHRRTERRGRNRRRHRGRPLWRQRPPGHPGREGAAGPGDEGAAARRAIHRRLRPHRAHRPRGQDARRKADRGKHRGGAGLHCASCCTSAARWWRS